MKKLILLSLIPVAVTLSGCTAFSQQGEFGMWGSDAHNQMVDGILEPGYYPDGQHARNYKAPRKYYVTQEDEHKYNSISSRVQQRQQQLQQKKHNNYTPSPTATYNHNTYDNQPSHDSETNY